MIAKICVIGAGTMGAGIAQSAIEHGIDTTLVDTEEKFVDRGVATIRGFLEKKVAKGKMTSGQFAETTGMLHPSTRLVEAVQNAEMVIEAVFEDLAVKQKIFAELDLLCPPDVILASNTSTLSITAIASVTANPRRVAGAHFFSPVPLMKLVEVIRGEETADDVVSAVVDFVKALEKSPVVAKDVPGFIVNRFLCLLYNEAADQIDRGMATAENIDAAMKLGANHPMGPLEIMDMAGVDVAYNALRALYAMTGEERYKPSPLFERMIAENRLGRKTGRGFYAY
jgi:3-hydroxybutyryl-CoA dehydrogenase